MCLARARVRLWAVSAVVRRQTELTSLGLWWGLRCTVRFAALNSPGMPLPHYQGWGQGSVFLWRTPVT